MDRYQKIVGKREEGDDDELIGLGTEHSAEAGDLKTTGVRLVMNYKIGYKSGQQFGTSFWSFTQLPLRRVLLR